PAPYPQCQGGTVYEPNSQICYYQAHGNVSENNTFAQNGGYGNPTNGDIGLATAPNNPGNCFSGDTDAGGLTTDPPGIEQNPLYTPTAGMCTSPNGGDDPVLVGEALCATQLLGPPCPPGTPVTNYDRPAAQFPLLPIPTEASMPNPCAGVPSNPW